MGDMDNIFKKEYDTETVKDNPEDIKKDASEQDNNLLPKLNSLNESLEFTFTELLKTLKDEKETETEENVKNTLEYEEAKFKEVEKQVETEMEKARQVKIDVEFLNQLRESEEKQMKSSIINCTTELKKLEDSFPEAPKQHDGDFLKGELNELRKSAEQLKENLTAMQKEISTLKEMFHQQEDKDLSSQNLKAVMKSSGDADLVISWLAQKNDGWIKEN